MATRYARRQKAPSYAQPERIAEGLGWLSVGLGLAQIFAPRAVCRLAGVPVSPTFVRICGLRELACGIGILTHEHSALWVQARVAGDAIDLAALAGSAAMQRADGRRIALAMAVVGGVTALDMHCSRALAEADAKVPRHIKASIAVNLPPDGLYRYWRDLQNFPRLMPYVESVQPLGDDCYHWVAKGPAGKRIEWDSEVIDDKPNERLAWRSMEGSDVFNAGSVRFDSAPVGRGTYVTVELLYQSPPGSIATTVARLFGKEADHEVRADLRAFKTLMETGEIATTAGLILDRPDRNKDDPFAGGTR